MRPHHAPWSLALLLIAALSPVGCAHLTPAGRGVRIIEKPGHLEVNVNGQPFTEYHFQDVPRPYFYPVLGADGLAMTRKWPQEAGEGEEHDHPHHRSLWFSHGSVNGKDFWSEVKSYGHIVHEGFTKIKSGGNSGIIASRDKWVDAEGTVVCTDDRVMTIYNPPAGRMFDFQITIHASHGDVVFGDTKEGTMAVRIAETMRQKQPKGKEARGHIVNSEGVRDGDTWGKRADWVDYYGPVDGKIVGIAIFDHPANPRHPTTWHVRDYGLFAANPFGLHDFEKAAPGTGDLKIPAGQSVTFRYRFILHEGDEKQASIAAKYREYAR